MALIGILIVLACLALLLGAVLVLVGRLARVEPIAGSGPEVSVSGLVDRLRQLEHRVGALEDRLERIVARSLDQPPLPPGTPPFANASEASEPGGFQERERPKPLAPLPPSVAPAMPAVLPTPAMPPVPRPRRPIAPPEPPVTPAWLVRLQEHWSENWTGILGTAAVVAGVTFVAIHLTLRLDAFQRFLLVTAVASGMASPSLLVGRQERWRDLSDWLRSGGAALFLFGCTASGGLPQLGLQWIPSPGPALALLSLGLALNLLAAAIARTQAVAALHGVLALIPLAISPQSWQTLLLASVVTLVGELLPGRRRWEGHRLAVGCCYGLFHLTWVVRSPGLLESDPQLRQIGCLLGLLVFGTAVLLDHRPRWAAPQLTPLPLVLALSNWGWLALGLLIDLREAGPRAVALACAAALALLLSRVSGRARVHWQRRSDRLVAQALAMAALLSLRPVLTDATLLVFLLLAESLAFLALAVLERDGLIREVGWWVTATSAALLALVGVEIQEDPIQSSALLIGASLALSLVAHGLRRRGLEPGMPPLLGWLAGLLVFLGAATLPPPPWQMPISLGAMGGLLLLVIALRPPGLRLGVCGAVLLLHLRQWLMLSVHQPWLLQQLPGELLPLMALASLVVAAGRGCSRPAAGARSGPAADADPEPFLRPLGLYLIGINLLLGSDLLIRPISPLAVGVAWLLLAVLSLELADRLPLADAGHVLLLGVIDLGAFALSYLLVISQSPADLQLAGLTLRGRLLIELFAIAVAFHWWCCSGLHSLRRSRLWRRLQPCFLEICLLAVAVTILGEIPTLWRPVAWSLLALSLLSQPLRQLFAARLQVYAVIVHWLAVATLVANLSTLSSPSSHWSQQPETIALLAIAVQVAFIVASHHWLRAEDLRQPGGPPLLGWIGERVARRPHRWLYIPEFIAVALYLAIRYDHALLTLLWALEAFVIYGLSALLRDSSFRYVALGGMGACLLRLVSVDLAQADLGLRGLVFIGVGLLMLGMNTIYTRFWSDP
ncbi:MAG: hypothetical protein ACKO0M_08170 [Cyanobium sp.]